MKWSAFDFARFGVLFRAAAIQNTVISLSDAPFDSYIFMDFCKMSIRSVAIKNP